MTERMLQPAEYTPQIWKSIEILKHRMDTTLIKDYSDDTIAVVEYDGITYILANPILGEEPIFDEFGQLEELVPMYNITLIYPRDWIRFEPSEDFDKLQITMEIPRTRVLRPDLCMKIMPDGMLVDGGRLE